MALGRRVLEYRSTLPTRVNSRLRQVSIIDVIVGLGVLVLLFVIVRVGKGTTVSFSPSKQTSIDTSPSRLPYYAARTLLRMFTALVASTLFTFVYGYTAARSRRAEKILIPALDILQSVPILGFLSITVTAFIRLFPGSLLGLEFASIFAIFTSQAWNMTFSFYHSLITLPHDLDEASRMLRLPRWMRFWRLEVPNAAIGLVWNGMMSMAGGWFFLTAAEAISVLGKSYTLPGVGAYAAQANLQGDLGKVGWAIVAMIVLIVGVNVLFWRPLVAWSEKFKNEQSEAAEVPRSFVLDFLRRSHWPKVLGRARRRAAEPFNAVACRLSGTDDVRLTTNTVRERTGDAVFWTVATGLIGWGMWRLWSYLTAREGVAVFWTPLWQGSITLLRVAVLVVVSTLIWVPIGVHIGLNPRMARVAQPFVQILASFPANFLFPLATYVFIKTGLNLNVGGIFLMALGAQWYILFNTIAGAQAIPSDLKEAMDNLGVHGWLRWRKLIIPAIFPYYVTGGITASGGAWNASIVAEIVGYHGTTLTATGLGAYIAAASSAGDFHHILAGVAVMSAYVVGVNRLLWKRLYRLAEARFSL